MTSVIDLTKKVQIVLEKKQLVGVQAQVKVATDISGSMNGLFRSGIVQSVLNRLLAVGMKMDVDKSIDIYAFNNHSKHIGDATFENHENFVNHVFLNKVSVSGGTNYGPVMKDIIADSGGGSYTTQEQTPAKGFMGKLFGKTTTVEKVISPEAQPHPTLVFFLTDGDNYDKDEARAIIQEASKQGIFWQFIGIGRADFEFLESLDDMPGRYLDNANFFSVNDIDKISDEELYERLLGEFPLWLKQAKEKGLVQ